MACTVGTKNITIAVLACCFELGAYCLAQIPKPIVADYDVTLQEPGVRFNVTAGAATPQDELWLGMEVGHAGSDADIPSHLWKLDKSGKRVVDIEIKHPDNWTSGAKKGDSSTIREIGLTAQGPKVYVDYSNRSQFWALQLDNAGELLLAKKIIAQSDEGSGGIWFSPDMSQAVVMEGPLELSHLNKEDKLDWTIHLPLKEDEATILDVMVRDQIFVRVFGGTSDAPITQIFTYDFCGKLLQKAALPGLYMGLSTVGGLVQLFHLATSNDTLAVVVLDPHSLQIRKEVVIPDVRNFAALLKAGDKGTALIVSRKDTSDIGVLVLDKDQQQRAYRPMHLDFYPGYLFTTLLGKTFIAGNERVFMLAPEKTPGTARVISVSLPVN